MVTKRQTRKVHSVSAIFLIYSIFSNRNQISLFSRKVYGRFITMTVKKGGVPMLVGELQPFFNWQSSISRQICHVFTMHVHGRALNDAINYAQKGCAMQMWGMTLRSTQQCNTIQYNNDNWAVSVYDEKVFQFLWKCSNNTYTDAV